MCYLLLAERENELVSHFDVVVVVVVIIVIVVVYLFIMTPQNITLTFRFHN